MVQNPPGPLLRFPTKNYRLLNNGSRTFPSPPPPGRWSAVSTSATPRFSQRGKIGWRPLLWRLEPECVEAWSVSLCGTGMKGWRSECLLLIGYERLVKWVFAADWLWEVSGVSVLLLIGYGRLAE